LKKVVVVVKFTNADVTLEGNDLKMIDSASAMVAFSGKMLVVKDGKEQIAVFNEWLYWKKLE